MFNHDSVHLRKRLYAIRDRDWTSPPASPIPQDGYPTGKGRPYWTCCCDSVSGRNVPAGLVGSTPLRDHTPVFLPAALRQGERRLPQGRGSMDTPDKVKVQLSCRIPNGGKKKKLKSINRCLQILNGWTNKQELFTKQGTLVSSISFCALIQTKSGFK